MLIQVNNAWIMVSHTAQKLSDKKLAVLGTGKLRDFAASLLETGAFLAEARYGDGEARRKGHGASEGTGCLCDDRKPQGGTRRGHRAARREAASGGRSVERDCAGAE